MGKLMPPADAVSDKASIGRDADNKKDRRLALDACLNGMWSNADIGELERVDTPDWHGWKMWLWQEV